MQLGGRPPKQSNNLFDEDFASGFEDSKLDKFKPLLKALTVLLVIVGLGIGGLWIYGDSASRSNYAVNSDKSNLADSYKPVSGVDDAVIKFNDCTKTATDKTKDLQTSDPEFSKKLIAGYDEWLACYDKYPKQATDASPGKSSLELARQSAIDSSGGYKDSYLSSNSYDYTPSTYSSSYDSSDYNSTYNSDTSTSSNSTSSIPSKNPTTGCSYSLSDSDYRQCTNNYYDSQYPSSSTSAGGSTQDPVAVGYTKCINDAYAAEYPSNGDAIRARAIKACNDAYNR